MSDIMNNERYDIIKSEFELKEELKMQTQTKKIIELIDGE